MMTDVDLWSHPFRLDGAGNVATVVAGSDDHAAEAIVIIASTAPGERALVPGFGLADPTFGDGLLDLAGLNAQLALYGPPGVVVSDAAVDVGPDGAASVALTYDTDPMMGTVT
jgi:hypothetical protein